MKKEEERSGRRINLKGTPVIFILVAVIILIIVSFNYLSFLEEQLFQERKTHIVEFTDKASEIVDSIIEYSWQQLFACEYIIKNEEITSKEDLSDILNSMSDFIDQNHSLVIAFDKSGNYYSSDNSAGRWPKTELLTSKADDYNQVVSEIPHKKNSYFILMERLKESIIVDSEGTCITHIAIAVDMDAMRDKISIKGFGDQCYTYLIDRDGVRLYKYTYVNNFIENYNVLNSFQNYEIVNGGTYDNFVAQMKEGKNTALEFEFMNDDGIKNNWFVANAALSSGNLQMLLFVPTEVLGADSNVLLHRTIWFFAIVSIIIFVLIIIIVIVMMVSKADKKLVYQKDIDNHLLKTAVDEANSANRAKSDFLSNMSHDIRTPINGIMGMTDIALKNIGNQDKVLDCLKKISGSSQHLLGLINDVLDMSRIESGKTKVNHESFNIGVCIDNCASIIGGQLATRDIELIKELENFEHFHLIGDELHLRQVFINILGNSVKFTPDGGKIYFRAVEKEVKDGKALFQFELSDTGIGMKPEFLPHIFDAFAQEDNGSRTTYKGTGLGMAITKQFIDLMGGTIEVQSELNKGTTFLIELWIDIDENVNTNEVDANLNVNLKGMKVLLVEDIELNMEIAQSILEEEGAVITPVMNGQEAVDAFRNSPPNTFDIILMDIMMPVMDGITATRTIRELERPDAKTIPILAMTANAYEEDIRNTKAAGMNAHLSKPLDINIMFKTLSHFYPVSKEQTQTIELPGLKILLADDVELNLEIARTILEEEGAVVTTVENGQEAVNAFDKNPEGTFDIILMDVHMPVMDGFEATKAIRLLNREDARKIPILAMTADVYEEDMQKTKEAGMNGHLTKPLNIEQMMWILSGYKEIS